MKKERIGFLIVVWLALILTVGIHPCQAQVYDVLMASSEPQDYWPAIHPGDNDTTILLLEYARWGLTLIKAIGLIATLWGLLEFGTSVYHHDSSVKVQGVLHVIGGILMCVAEKIIIEWGIFH